MKVRNHFPHFKKAVLHPRVFIFLIIGGGVMFLTFLTQNNALEIAISGIASIFIGIGINNLTSLEVHLKDEKKLKSKMKHILNLLEIIQARLKIIHEELDTDDKHKIKAELAALQQTINLGAELIKEDAFPD